MQRPDPQDYQPPISVWGHVWRLVVCVLVSALVSFEMWPYQWSGHRVWVWVSVVLGALAFVLVQLRRRHPMAVMLAVNALSVVSSVAVGPAMLAIVSVATRRRWSELAGVAVVGSGAGLLYYRIQPSPHDDPIWLELAFNVMFSAAMIGWGMFLGSRRELVWTLRERAERAETEQGLRVREARGAERSRIAREMHDVLAHRISQISMRAGALAFRHDLPAAELRSGLGLIQEQSHAALEDLRGVLGVLRQGEGGPLHSPQPTYGDLDELVEAARRDGLDVDYTDEVEAGEGVPDLAGRTLYRIVQEGITNARKHAPGARLRIDVTGSREQGITVELCNLLGFAQPGRRPPGAGLGLVGLGERAALAGGRLEHRSDGRTFRLTGWIPWAP